VTKNSKLEADVQHLLNQYDFLSNRSRRLERKCNSLVWRFSIAVAILCTINIVLLVILIINLEV